MRRKLNFSVFQWTILSILLMAIANMEGKSLAAERAFENLQLKLKPQTSQSQLLKEGQDVEIICPFNQAIWYHNEQFFNTNRTLKMKSFNSEEIGTYSCLSQIPVTQSAEIQWANITLNVCNTSSDTSFCKILLKTKETVSIESQENNLKEKFNENLRAAKLLLANENSNPKKEQITKESNSHLKDSQILFSSGEVESLQENSYEPPKFKTPQFYNNTHKYKGSFAIFNCNVYSNPVANISWYFNNRTIDVTLAKYKAKKWSLNVMDLLEQDTGMYTCQICNTYGCINRSSFLKVIEREVAPPIIRENSSFNQSVREDDNVKFECDVISDLEPHIIWLKHDDLLNLTNNRFDYNHNPNAVKLLTRLDEPHILRLGSVQSEDQGWYSCIAANNLGEAISTSYLQVVQADNTDLLNNSEDYKEDVVTEPSLEFNSLNLEQPDNDESLDHDLEHDTKHLDVEEEKPPQFKNINKLVDIMHKPSGSSLQLLCPATGNPLPNITWTRNDTEIERHIGKVTYKKWSIQLDDAITKDSGVYKCSVCNTLGCIEHTTKVTVSDRLRSRPIISDKFPQNQTVLTNSSTYLECRVVSDLEPYIVWLKYTKKNESIEKLEKVVPNFSNDQKMLTKDVVILDRDPDKPNILNFTKVSHEDEGWYTCVAASSLGQTVASAYMRVVDKLPQRDGLQRGHPVWITTVAIVVVLLFLLGTVFIVYVLRNLKHEKLLKQRIETVHQWTKKVIIYKPPPSEGSSCDLQMPVIKIEKQRTTFTTSSNSDPANGFNEYEFPLDSNWEIPRSQLSLGSTLGEGAFGRVVMAQASASSRVTANGATSTIVAVKMVKDEHTDADMASLVREMEVMKMIGKHINIINLLGCCSQNGPLWVIVEFAPHGNLKDFLKKNRPLSGWGSCSLKRNSEYLEEKTHLTEKHLTSFAFQIARGMEYLASRRVSSRKYLKIN